MITVQLKERFASEREPESALSIRNSGAVEELWHQIKTFVNHAKSAFNLSENVGAEGSNFFAKSGFL